jgi:DNA-binding NtrC family response regulator
MLPRPPQDGPSLPQQGRSRTCGFKSGSALQEGPGLTALQRELRGISAAGFVLMSGAPSVHRVVEAMRLGAMDFLVKPFDLAQLTSAVSDALTRQQDHSQLKVRHLRMRSLVKRALKDRRQMRKRVDLVCRDLVQAYRRLAKRVAELHELYGYQQNN